ncbi:hypothetical protein L3X38_038688 [Prunus dulcis]|uniref:Heat shock protein 70 n=1 Tax=Prunus dulcis TaxID=3755 RepID=A0AAD4V5U4_PRUDU|nr:hypothetical protein L3X38_038688 [Prunus dulcis]
MAAESPAIGIDLGTTYSCVAVWQKDHAEIIANDQGKRTTRSYVTFTESNRLVTIVSTGDKNAMQFVIRRNTRVPVVKETTLVTVYDNQRSIRFAIYEGESTSTVNNNYLGEFSLDDIPPAPKGVPEFNVCFDIDSNGILSVSAEDMLTGQKKGITINRDTPKNA